MNPALAPRMPKCRACSLVATIEDLAYRMFDKDLNPLPIAGAVDYLRTVGLTGTSRQLAAIVLNHRRHVEKFLDRGAQVAPAQIVEGISRIPPPRGDVGWVDVNQGVMSAGDAARQILMDRLQTNPGGFETKDLTAIMNSGSTAATSRASAEMKGQIRRAEALAKLASGFSKP